MESRSEDEELKTNRPFNTPSWASTTNIYEVNVRQYTPEGTFEAFRKHLPRLADMGVEVLWFMPIYPISELKRKGKMGSYYASSDFLSVNPEFGTLEEFISMVEEIHALGMYVILDWTANHTGWDHPWVKEHPEFYIKREGTDEIRHAFNPQDGAETDWYDIAQLNFDNPDLTPVMIEQMRFWRKRANIDGFRCDVAGFIPLHFWYAARPALEQDGPLFMLAEWGNEPMHFEAAFDVNYGMDFHHLLNRLAKGEARVADVWAYQEKDHAQFPQQTIHLNYTSNHDENSWNGTEFERMGELADAMWVVCVTFDGIPLVYSGQEEPLHRRLAFFEKDDIQFSAFAKTHLFKPLLKARKEGGPLAAGSTLNRAQRVELAEQNDRILAYQRTSDMGTVLVFVNTSGEQQSIQPKEVKAGEYADLYAEKRVVDYKSGETSFLLKPYGYLVLESL
jgi:glycosidase